MKTFVFESYRFVPETLTAEFRYSFDQERSFVEKVRFESAADKYDEEALERAMFLAFMLTGVSYYKLFPGSNLVWRQGGLDKWQSEFLSTVYQEGLGQFAFENGLTRDDLAHFEATKESVYPAVNYEGSGVLALQSGGKDSLLTAELLAGRSERFDSFYVSSSAAHPQLLDQLGDHLYTALRQIDIPGIKAAIQDGGMNGHIPVTFVVLSFAVIQAVLLGKEKILVSIGHEGVEPHEYIGDLAVNHQWSKTWPAEQLFSEYVNRYVSPRLKVGSPLRQYSELRIAELFVEKGWKKYGHTFSSCNVANYKQGTDNSELKWCGECPKCANSYLLFAPFVDASDLKSLFDGQDLFAKPSLERTFKGLLGIDGVMKPFECVGETYELRLAYHMALAKDGYTPLPFDVPESHYDYKKTFPHQLWAEL